MGDQQDDLEQIPDSTEEVDEFGDQIIHIETPPFALCPIKEGFPRIPNIIHVSIRPRFGLCLYDNGEVGYMTKLQLMNIRNCYATYSIRSSDQSVFVFLPAPVGLLAPYEESEITVVTNPELTMTPIDFRKVRIQIRAIAVQPREDSQPVPEINHWEDIIKFWTEPILETEYCYVQEILVPGPNIVEGFEDEDIPSGLEQHEKDLDEGIFKKISWFFMPSIVLRWLLPKFRRPAKFTTSSFSRHRGMGGLSYISDSLGCLRETPLLDTDFEMSTADIEDKHAASEYAFLFATMNTFHAKVEQYNRSAQRLEQLNSCYWFTVFGIFSGFVGIIALVIGLSMMF